MKFMMGDIINKKNKGGWGMAGVGLVMAGVGRAVGGTLGAGLMRFGLANVLLGVADIFMPELRKS